VDSADPPVSVAISDTASAADAYGSSPEQEQRLHEALRRLKTSMVMGEAPTLVLLSFAAGTVCVCWLFIFEDTEPSPLRDSFSVRQQGGLPGPPPRSPPPRIHRRPGGLPLTAQHYSPVVSGPNCFQSLGSSPGLPQSPML